MVRILYSSLFYLALPLIVLRLLWRSARAPAYRRRWAERFGFFPVPDSLSRHGGCIWVHAVSVGETLAAVPLIRKLRETHPDRSIAVTTMTPTGSERVREMLGDEVFHVYAPYDYPGAVERFLDRLRPDLLIIMETELWPNIVHYSHKRGVKILLANARLSPRSARGYARFRALTEPMLSRIDCIGAQAEADATRFRELGCGEEQLRVTGSIKFDFSIPEDLAQRRAELRELIGLRPVWLAASTRAGEEEKVLAAHRLCLQEQPDLLLLLVPRHPERFDGVRRLCAQEGFTLVRRSEKRSVTPQAQVFLGDSMGEMLSWLSIADLAFVGGSLVDTGCHNVLEPAALALPVLTGPSQFNFSTVCSQLEQAGGLKTVTDEKQLAQELITLLREPARAAAMGRAAARVVDENRGALERTWRLAALLVGSAEGPPGE